MTDYDTLVNAVKRQNEVTKKLETDLAKTRNENKTLHVDLSKIQSESQVVKVKQILDQEVTSLEKEFGTQAVTNKVIASVEKEYIDNDVSKMPTKPRVTWIKDKLRLRFMQETSKTKSHSGSSANDNAGIKVDTGTGGSKPSDEIPEGDYKTVSKAMAARDARLGV